MQECMCHGMVEKEDLPDCFSRADTNRDFPFSFQAFDSDGGRTGRQAWVTRTPKASDMCSARGRKEASCIKSFARLMEDERYHLEESTAPGEWTQTDAERGKEKPSGA
ncbi:hypothetical protein NDU88_008228 [Pleurodeles waltl]|uniref:Uncharacterized protein n=1 Tax=Pleurodeles waltl TaxID=8319 RepID=A0AAV7N8I2_PLEWA|nr:hypothetical protein NDU88_008228 [Pleurodeles waltl]